MDDYLHSTHFWILTIYTVFRHALFHAKHLLLINEPEGSMLLFIYTNKSSKESGPGKF